MPSTPNQPEEKFLEANNYWNLEELYIDLAKNNGGKRITPKQKEFLRGILLYQSPSEIAKISCCGVDWVKQALGQLYPIIEKLLNLSEKTCKVYSKVPFLLKKYQLANNNQSPNSSQLAQIWEASQETQQQEQPVTTCSDNQSWQTLEDVMPYLEIFYHHCELEQYIQAFNTIFDKEDYDNCIYKFLSSSGYIHQIVNLYERLVQSWKRKLRESEKWEFSAAITCLGDAYERLGNYKMAIVYHEESLKIAQDIGNLEGEAGSRVNLGLVYYSLEQHQEAMKCTYSGLNIARQIGHREFEANALNNLGLIYKFLEQYHLAIDYYHHSLEIEYQISDGQGKDEQGKAGSLINMGDAYRNLEQPYQAIEYLLEGIEVAHQSGKRQFEANGWFNLGLTLEQLVGQESEAMLAYENARKLFQEMGLDACIENCNDAIQHLSEELDRSRG